MCGCRAGLESNLHSTVSAGPLLIQSDRQHRRVSAGSMQINQKGSGYKGTTAAERTSTLSCHHYAIIAILSVNSPLMQHLCLSGFQACCFGEHAVVNMAVCGRTYERSSSGDGDILSVYQGELRGDCLSIS